MTKQEIYDYLHREFVKYPSVRWLNPINCNSSISNEMSEFIRKTFKQVATEDFKGRKWFKVHNAKYDSKYGAYMVCFDTEEWRETTANEFYGSREDYR